MGLYNKDGTLLFLLLLISTAAFSQFYNSDVEAKINIDNNNEFAQITGTANNKTEINQSIRFVLSVIKTDPQTAEQAKDEQSGRVVLQSTETKELSTTAINSNETDRIVILLLLYDTENNIIGMDRILLNGGKEDEDKSITTQLEEKYEPETTVSEDVYSEGEDGIYLLKGIVVEDTKTKPGRDFYAYFSTKYNDRKINGEKIITVNEIFALGRNTKIEIKAEDELIFQFFVKPKDDFLKEMSDYAIEYVDRYFKRLAANKDQIRHY